MTTDLVIANAQVRDIPIDHLFVSRDETRKTIEPAALKDLAASIALKGVQEPLIVRLQQVPQGGRKPEQLTYEIVAGQRRHAASKLAGKGSCPCIVREFTDAEAREFGIVSNLQREDLSPMEQAQAFGELLKQLGSIAAVSAKVGKEQSYVAKRLKLLTLTLCASDALREGLITVDHALLLARLGADEQDAALKWCVDPQAGSKTSVEMVIDSRLHKRTTNADEDDDDTDQAARRSRWNREWEPQSVQRLKEHIECESGVPLDRAPWSLEDRGLMSDVGACAECPQNTKANVPLFGDLDMGVAVCTDGGCFKAKTSEFIQIEASRAARPRLSERDCRRFRARFSRFV
jgi:ParB family chromosome partitioning protein